MLVTVIILILTVIAYILYLGYLGKVSSMLRRTELNIVYITRMGLCDSQICMSGGSQWYR